jgi:hypothetical protein
VDFPDEAPEEAPGSTDGLEGWSCPVTFGPVAGQGTDLNSLCSAFQRETAELRPWYDLSIEKRGRSAVGKFGPDLASEILAGFALGEKRESPEPELSLATILRLAVQDLKAYYFEAATARPGSSFPTSGEFNRWFWQETAAARILRAVKDRCLKEEDGSLRMAGALLLIPLDQN